MGIRQLEPIRRVSKPLVYFKGTVDEALLLTPRKIGEAFNRNLPTPFDLTSKWRLGKLAELKALLLRDADKPGRGHRLILARTPSGHVLLQVRRSDGKLLVTQYPLNHNVTAGGKILDNEEGPDRTDPFVALRGILEHGFKGKDFNALPLGKRHSLLDDDFYLHKSTRSETRGDMYSIELMSTFELIKEGDIGGAKVKSAAPGEILRVNILLNPRLDSKKREERMKFYRKHLKLPIAFLSRPKGLSRDLDFLKPND